MRADWDDKDGAMSGFRHAVFVRSPRVPDWPFTRAARYRGFRYSLRRGKRRRDYSPKAARVPLGWPRRDSPATRKIN